ncbi:hypothetical protein EDC01DRAFT_635180 [Geopyxis carbonaria]|nr:hypothetical protein EDC01DRAFT_635180 [Geopyxis carbonaria]
MKYPTLPLTLFGRPLSRPSHRPSVKHPIRSALRNPLPSDPHHLTFFPRFEDAESPKGCFPSSCPPIHTWKHVRFRTEVSEPDTDTVATLALAAVAVGVTGLSFVHAVALGVTLWTGVMVCCCGRVRIGGEKDWKSIRLWVVKRLREIEADIRLNMKLKTVWLLCMAARKTVSGLAAVDTFSHRLR